jgi:hypothetical protein
MNDKHFGIAFGVRLILDLCAFVSIVLRVPPCRHAAIDLGKCLAMRTIPSMDGKDGA